LTSGCVEDEAKQILIHGERVLKDGSGIARWPGSRA
jgi:hypothetical protein